MARVVMILGAAATVLSACASDNAELEAYEPAPALPPAYEPDTPVIDIRKLGLRRIDEFVGYPMEDTAGGGSTQPLAVLAEPASATVLIDTPKTVEVALVETPEVAQLAAAATVVQESEAIEDDAPVIDDGGDIERASLPSLTDLLDWAPALPQVGRTAVLVSSQRD